MESFTRLKAAQDKLSSATLKKRLQENGELATYIKNVQAKNKTSQSEIHQFYIIHVTNLIHKSHKQFTNKCRLN